MKTKSQTLPVLAALITSGLFLFAPSREAAAEVLWIGDSAGNVGRVDLTTRAVTVVGSPGVLSDLAFDPAGNLWGLGFATNPTRLYRVNTITGAVTVVGSSGVNYLNGLVFDTEGKAYAATSSGNPTAALYTLNTTTGAATLVGNTGGHFSSGDLAFSLGSLYLSAEGTASTDRLVRLNPSTGAGTLVGNFGRPDVYGFAGTQSGDLYAVSGTTIYSVNPATGATTALFNYSGQGLGVAYGTAFVNEAAVPEPSSVAAGLLLAATVLMGRRRRAARR